MNVRVQDLAAELSEETMRVLVVLAQATPVEKRTWQPLENGRSVLEQMMECALANHKWATILTTRSWYQAPEDLREAAYSEADTLEKVQARLQTTTEALVAAIRAVKDEELSTALEAPWGPYTVARGCMHAYWNMVYHEGQINYIQTLYGDFDEHDI